MSELDNLGLPERTSKTNKDTANRRNLMCPLVEDEKNNYIRVLEAKNKKLEIENKNLINKMNGLLKLAKLGKNIESGFESVVNLMSQPTAIYIKVGDKMHTSIQNEGFLKLVLFDKAEYSKLKESIHDDSTKDSLHDIVYKDDLPGMEKAFETANTRANTNQSGKEIFEIRAIKNKEKITEDDYPFVHFKGEIVIKKNTININGEETELSYYVVLYNDITDFRIAEQQRDIFQDQLTKLQIKYNELKEKNNNNIIAANELVLMNDDLNTLVEALRKYIRLFDHDIKNPFGALQGYLDILKTEYNELTEDEKIEFITNSVEAADGMGLIMENLNYQKLLTGDKISPDFENLDIQISISNAIKENISLAKKKHISIISNVDSDLAYIDKDLIGSVLRNLISNAIKFTLPDGSITIDSIVGSDFIEISVSDTGKGIPEDKIEKVFDKSESTLGTRGEKGTGFGLPTCREFIELHGGTIRAESDGKTGSKFIFTIPVQKQDNESQNTTNEPVSKISSTDR